jgi:hypothetical protein
LTKALRTFRSNGLAVASVEIDSETGKITIRSSVVEGTPIASEEERATRALNEWLVEKNNEESD